MYVHQVVNVFEATRGDIESFQDGIIRDNLVLLKSMTTICFVVKKQQRIVAVLGTSEPSAKLALTAAYSPRWPDRDSLGLLS